MLRLKRSCQTRQYVRYCSSDVTDELTRIHEETRKVLLLIRTFKQYGHLVAKLDPLRLEEKNPSLRKWTHGPRVMERPYFATFNLKTLEDAAPIELVKQGFSLDDLDRKFYIGKDLEIGPKATLRQIISECRRIFCGTIGTEYQHLHNRDACKSIRRELERYVPLNLISEDKRLYFQQLANAELFERFLGRRFSGAKRFSIEGGESLIPGLNALFQKAHDEGVEVVHMGMAHRGRLNVLANVLQRPLRSILSQFQPYLPDDPEYPNNSDDVRYHLGTTSLVRLKNGETLEVNLTANPSHLEAVNSVVLGEARARQFKMNDDGTRVMALLLHGDAAMFQGSVREAFGFGQLSDYKTGGTVHVIINNQIGFTTLPKEADSAVYCSDVAKLSGVPVFHVNGDDVEAVVKVMQMAMSYRQKFQRDVVIDLVCYRRHGHNEQDSPEITAPTMYNYIKRHPSTVELYHQKLMEEGVVKEGEMDQFKTAFESNLMDEYNMSKENPSSWNNSGDFAWRSQWFGAKESRNIDGEGEMITGIRRDHLEKLGSVLFHLPGRFTAHKKVEAIYNNRLRAVETGDRVDWATAEALAFASLLSEGVDVRLSGQDCERGTFNQRHAVLYDQDEATPGKHVIYIPFDELTDRIERGLMLEGVPQSGQFQICNSPLSEEGALAFEYGYSLQTSDGLTLWEAQFGDFANGAQTIIDTFIASGEQKWQHETNLVLLLPHGYEGQGPEHSSGRIERFLQMTNEDPDEFTTDTSDVNLRVIYPSTPAQYFHALRRQVVDPCRKPLVLFTPKYLLHHRPCNSDLDDMREGTSYTAVMPPHPQDEVKMETDDEIKKLILCTGKIYYPLLHTMRARNVTDIATARVEQLAPFPFEQVAAFIQRYRNAEIVWFQEEPKNMGAWTYMEPRLRTVAKHLSDDRTFSYVGRPPSASPATGQYEIHVQEMTGLINEALK